MTPHPTLPWEMDFIYYKWNQGRLSSLITYSRYALFNFISRSPTIFYDKVFTKSYQPFWTRNNVVLIVGMLAIFKYNIYQREKQGLDQQSCCCFAGCPLGAKCPFSSR